MKLLVALLAFLALLAVALAAPHKKDVSEGYFDYDYKLFDDDMFDREGVAVDRMIGKKVEKQPAKKEHHHHHHHHHHHKEHLKTNRVNNVRSFIDDFKL